MRTYNGSDIKYLLEKKGYNLSAVGREIGVSPQAVHNVVWGEGVSSRIVAHIERLLGLKPGSMKISRVTNRKKAA